MLEIWGEQTIQRQLKDAIRNIVVFRKIASALEAKHLPAVQGENQGAEKKYKESVDRLRASGVGVDFDKDADESEIFVRFKWFADIHKVLGRRAVINPPLLLESSNLVTGNSDRQSSPSST